MNIVNRCVLGNCNHGEYHHCYPVKNCNKLGCCDEIFFYKILVTGCAGFIGYHLCWQLLQNKRIKVYGVDNLNSYYDVNLKQERLRNLKKMNSFKFFKLDIVKKTILKKNFVTNKYDVVINLAAQAGVRHSIENQIHMVNLIYWVFLTF